MHNQSPQQMTQIAVYRGATGMQSTYPVREGMTPPSTITTASGDVRQLVAITTPGTVVGATSGVSAAHAA